MGSGAVYFHLAGHTDNLKEAYLNDSLKELVVLYQTIENSDLYRMMKNINNEIYWQWKYRLLFQPKCMHTQRWDSKALFHRVSNYASIKSMGEDDFISFFFSTK